MVLKKAICKAGIRKRPVSGEFVSFQINWAKFKKNWVKFDLF
jgi:hypothetical protein